MLTYAQEFPENVVFIKFYAPEINKRDLGTRLGIFGKLLGLGEFDNY
jgi:hypothetical protein